VKPKGWRLDPAWVEHYSKIEQERIEREIERVKFAVQIEMDKIKMEFDKRQPKVHWEPFAPESVKEFWRGNGWKGA
jgi:hypothetical protein